MFVTAEPEPDSTPAESEPADPESEGAPAGKNSQPTGQNCIIVLLAVTYVDTNEAPNGTQSPSISMISGSVMNSH